MTALQTLGAELGARISRHQQQEAHLVDQAIKSFEAGEMEELRKHAARILTARAEILEWWSRAVKQAVAGLPRNARRQVEREVEAKMIAPAEKLLKMNEIEIGRQMLAAITKFETVSKAFAAEFADIFGKEAAE